MQPRLKCATLAAALLASALGHGAEHCYRVSIDARLERMQVQMHPGGPAPARIALPDPRFARSIHHLGYRDAHGVWRPLAVDGAAADIGSLPADASVGWEVALGGVAAADPRRWVTRIGADLIASPGAWMLRPQLGPGDSLLVTFELPEGIAVSTPWEPLGQGRYRVRPSPRGWRAVVAFGRFRGIELRVPGAVLRVALLDGRPPLDEAATLTWLRMAAEAVASVYGRFPVPSVQVVVTPVRGRAGFGGDAAGHLPASDEPLPFARVLRDGGVAVQFFADQRAPLGAYLEDRTAFHEFAHLLLPHVDRRDAWLSEGFASYYQHVLRARAGVQSEVEGWQALHDGFQRGDSQPYRDTLAESIAYQGPNMVMRMYWSGAAIALLADVALRSAAPADSLDGVLERLQRCCLALARTWSGRELFEQLDRLAHRRVFVALYDRYVNTAAFPDYADAYRTLGIGVRGGRIVLDDARRGAELRRAIMVRGGP